MVILLYSPYALEGVSLLFLPLEGALIIPPPLRGRREGVSELYSERPHLNPPLRGEDLKTKANALSEAS
jgi:hypothetical protein